MASRTVRWASLAALALSVFLAGCATQSGLDRAAVSAADREHFAGRLAVKVGGPDPRSVTATFDLDGNPQAGTLSLSTPLGSRIAEADWNSGEVVLITAKGRSRYPDLDSLTRDVLGESIPVIAMFDWLRARPWSGAVSRPVESLGSDPQSGFEQLGWTVDLRQFTERLVKVQRSSEPPVDVRVRLD